MKALQEKIQELDELKEMKEALLFDDIQGMTAEEKFETLRSIEERFNFLCNECAEIVSESANPEANTYLTEVNIRRIDPHTQLHLRKIFIAISLAKKANDPLYLRYRKGAL